MDLSKPFVKTYRKGSRMVMEWNLPNDTVGDFAFEWDLDGSQRKKWDEYLKELDEKGIRGQLVYRRMEWNFNPAFDNPDSKEYPLTSYSYKIIDTSDGQV